MRNNKFALLCALNDEAMEEIVEKEMEEEARQAAWMAEYDKHEVNYPWKSGQEFEDFRREAVARIMAGEQVSGEDFQKAEIYSVWYNKDKSVDRIFFDEDASYADWYERQNEMDEYYQEQEDKKYDQMLQELEDRS